MATENKIMTPWQGSGIVVANGNGPSATAKEALTKAGLDWLVEDRPLLTTLGGSEITGNYQKVESHKAIVRVTDEAILGVVGFGFEVFQNWEQFMFIDALVSAGLLKYHSAGSFKNGRVVWVQAEFAESEVVPGDYHKKYLLIVNAFDATYAIRINGCDTRVVCWNTFKMALREGKGRDDSVSIKHTVKMRDRVQAAKDALVVERVKAAQMDGFFKALASLRMTGDMWTDFSHKLIPNPEPGKSTTRAQNARAAMLELAVTGRGQDIPGVPGTAYAAFNAMVEYVNYERTARGETDDARQAGRFESTLFGSGGRLISTGIDVLNQYLVDHSIQVQTV